MLTLTTRPYKRFNNICFISILMHKVKRWHPNPISHTNEKPFQSATNLSLYQNCCLKKNTFEIALSKKNIFKIAFSELLDPSKLLPQKRHFQKILFQNCPLKRPFSNYIIKKGIFKIAPRKEYISKIYLSNNYQNYALSKLFPQKKDICEVVCSEKTLSWYIILIHFSLELS